MFFYHDSDHDPRETKTILHVIGILPLGCPGGRLYGLLCLGPQSFAALIGRQDLCARFGCGFGPASVFGREPSLDPLLFLLVPCVLSTKA